MVSGGRKKLFGNVISGAPFIKGKRFATVLEQRGDDSAVIVFDF